MIKKTLLLATVLFVNTSFFHPFYISTINFEHNKKQKTIELSVRAFVDDVEAAIKNNYKKQIDLSNIATNKEANEFLHQYLKSKIQIKLNDNNQTLNYVGYEINKESVWLYAEVSNINEIKSSNITCNWLYDFTQKQSNIINFVANSTEKNYKLDYPKNYITFNF